MSVPVTEVTLLEDRAHVTRRGTVSLGAARLKISIDGVAPVLVDKTLDVRVRGDGVRLIDTKVVRATVIEDQDKPADVREIDAAMDACDLALSALSSRSAALDARRIAVRKAGSLTASEISIDASWGISAPERWASDLDRITEQSAVIRQELQQIAAERLKLEIERRDLEAKLQAAESPASKMRASVVITLTCDDPGDGRSAEVTVEYVVPGACWRPYHTATLAGDEVELATDACVWQNTGEDWTNVQLELSTERPSLGSSPPSLSTDSLRVQKKNPTVQVQAREEAIHTAGLGGDRKVVMEDVPGIDDGGDALSLRAAERAIVRSDGRPHRVPLFSMKSPAKTSLVLMPELSSSALFKSVQSNTSPRPLLSGPVDLIRGGGLTGRTSIKYTAPGERFELGWGPDVSLRVVRGHERLEEESRMLSSWIAAPHRVLVRISNIGSEAKHLEVTERVPVSEVEKVQIEVDTKKTTDAVAADQDGFVNWSVRVPAYGTKSLKLAYTVKKHQDVVGL